MPHLIANAILIPEIAQLVMEGKTVTFTPGGVSMRPFIEGGRDSVLLGRADTLRVGDIVLAEIEQERYVLHRLVRMEGEQVMLMGDGNLYGEEHCTREQVLAKVLEIRSPKGCRKPMTRGRVWHLMLPIRRYLLKVYRHTPRLL